MKDREFEDTVRSWAEAQEVWKFQPEQPFLGDSYILNNEKQYLDRNGNAIEWRCYMGIGCSYGFGVHYPGPNCDISCPDNARYDPNWRDNEEYNRLF